MEQAIINISHILNRLEALHDLARKYRQEMILLKRELNSSGVFHSSANAHRVHCMYLMKLYKGIRADTIEDPGQDIHSII